MQNINYNEKPDSQAMLSLIDAYQPGFSLERPFYTSPSIYQFDLASVWDQQWIWVGHASQVSLPGDYFTFEFGNESVIIVRDSADTIRAHLNVCRHRGSRVCLESAGNKRKFTCPYHAWAYDLQGQLRSGRLMPDNFVPADYGLLPVNLFNFHGLIFICLSDTPPPIQSALDRLHPLIEPFDMSGLKIAHQASYPVPANWKLALENYLECYHCAPSHRQYSKSHSLKDPDAMTPDVMAALHARSIEAGLPDAELSENGGTAEHLGTDIYYRRYPLFSGYVTGSESGEALALLLGTLTSFDGGTTDIQIGPLNFFLAYSDHVVGYRFIPQGPQTTDIQTVWMVRSDAQEGIDYNLEQLTWLWHVTTQDDERIIRHNQQGVNSLHYGPGPLSTMEWGIADFHSNYLKMMSNYL